MLSPDTAKQYQVITASPTRLTLHSFHDQQPLWQKGAQNCLPSHVVKTAKRYPFFKLGKILGMETYRYLSIHEKYLIYFQEASGGVVKGICNLEQRYMEWHMTAKGKFLLVISNAEESSLLFFDNCNFWSDHRDELVRHCIRTNFQREYSDIEPIGEGSFASVFLVRNKSNGRKYAAKKICKFDKHNKSTKKLVVEERKILNQLSGNRHVSRFVELYEDNNEYVLVLEHIEGKDLLNFIKQSPDLPVESIKQIMFSALQCLRALHAQKIIHRDIKPQNILINADLRCKLIDFGLSIDIKPPLEKHNFRKCGTMGYMAPEVFFNEFACLRPYNTQSDVFSFGIVAHMLMLGNNPIKGRSYDETYELNRQCDIALDSKKITAKFGADGLQFLQNLLQKNPKQRYTAELAINSKFLQIATEREQKLSSSTLDERRKLSEDVLQK